MSRNKISQIKGKSNIKALGLKQASINEDAISKWKEKLVISFQYLDRNQGQTFEDWEKEGLLINMLNTLRDYCQNTMLENKGPNFKEYGHFPKESKFKHPEHVPKDASWASLHLSGRVCLGGHIYENIFYIVFLDKNHEFWISKKKHT